MPAREGLDRRRRAVLHPLAVHPPRQIYASTADRRRGRRWSRRQRHPWVPAALLAGAAAVAVVAGEVLRSIG
jgi:hypothetical protein